MKLALIFLSIFVAVSHQQYYHNPRMMFAFPWLAVPFPNQPAFYNNYDALSDSVYLMENSRNIFTADAEEEGEEFADTQSRIKGISRYRPRPSFHQDQQNARFLFNLFASTTGTFNNPLLKTATFTLTQTLTLASIVSCIPKNNFDPAVAVPPACRRKRSDEIMDDTENDQFPITPSETLGLMPTILSPSNDRKSNLLLSSKDDTIDEIAAPDHYLRDKRFFINKNQFVVSSTLTTYAFVNTTVTVVANLLPPLPAGVCVPLAAAAAADVVCLACLPAGYVVCPAPAG